VSRKTEGGKRKTTGEAEEMKRRNGKTGNQRKGKTFFLLPLVFVSVLGCDASLPESESPAARLYQQRCSTCHRLYAPSILTSEMWRFMLGRMELEMQRRGVPPPTPDERATLLEYLQKHAGG
jgi:hypothetical protein